ncbi:MAG: hypothetical protein PVTTEEND_000735 [Candidatus Fervidibacter sp.]|jgi:hypothetical protein
MRWLAFALILLAHQLSWAQAPELEQAIQVVRNWLGDPNAPVRFKWADDVPLGLEGPTNEYEFRAPGYIGISVDLNTMTVVDWVKEHVPSAGLPLLSDEQIKNIAFNYARANFPYFNEFPYWETDIFKFGSPLAEERGILKSIVWVLPYFINAQGQKIPCLVTGCRVNVDPYTGEVYGFGYKYIPMTLTNLTPNFSADEAKARIEQAFRNLGAAQVVAVMSVPEDIFLDAVDGLVIGATQTSGLRLAYVFDKVITTGAPGHEDEFGDTDHPALWRAAIDAHTGELFYREYWMGSTDEKDKQILRSNRPFLPFNIARENTTLLLSALGLIVLGMLLALVVFYRLRETVSS